MRAQLLLTGAQHRQAVGQMPDLLPFPEIWAVDFEFGSEPGDSPEPVCLVAWELRSSRKLRLWHDEFGAAPPYPTGPGALFVAYYASAEIGCHLALGWPVPERVLDLFTEFRNHTNGIPTVSGAGLLGALAHYGLDGIGTVEKDEMRDLILRGGPWTDAEREAILDYCESDVEALARLLPAMLPNIDLPRAMLRGRYMVAAARVERHGVPIDTNTLGLLKRHWSDIQDQLIAEIDTSYGVYEGRTFKADRFAAWLAQYKIPWPRLDSGRLDLATTHFGRWLAPTQQSRRCVNCAPRYPKCACPILPLGMTAATEPCCRHSERARAAISQATQSSYLDLASGFVG